MRGYMNHSKPKNRPRVERHDPNKPKILKKNYHVTTQTAYHITQLALQEGTSEGRILDKIVRNYLAASGMN